MKIFFCKSYGIAAWMAAVSVFSLSAQDAPDNNFVINTEAFVGSDSVRIDSAPVGYQLVWSDEFDSPESLKEKWMPMNWDAQRVNHELQTYRPPFSPIKDAEGQERFTAEVRDGILCINCFEGEDGKVYSARMDSKEAGSEYNDKAGWKYGYFEARIKIPSGLGTWPAFWMMPADWNDSDRWPDCGEIDIMEEVGADPNMAVCSLHSRGHNHTDKTQVSASRYIENMENDWKVYSMLWDEDHIELFADGRQILNYPNDGTGKANWPYDRPYHITLNLAWGGDWGGYKGVDESVLPVGMEVDYVRVYQKPSAE